MAASVTVGSMLAAQLRAQHAGPWNMGGVDHAAIFGDDLARRGVLTLDGATVRQVGTHKVEASTQWVHDGYAVTTYRDEPSLQVAFAGNLSLGYGDGSKGYAEGRLSDYTRAIARNTAGDGAVILTVEGAPGSRPIFVPRWQDTSDKKDIISAIVGSLAVVGAGLLAGAAPAGAAASGAAAGAEVATVAEAAAALEASTAGSWLGADLALSVPTAAVDLAGAGAASWTAAGAEAGAALFAQVSPGLVLAGGAAATAGAAVAAPSMLDKALASLQSKLIGTGSSIATTKIVAALTGEAGAMPAASSMPAAMPAPGAPDIKTWAALAAVVAAAAWALA